MINRFPEETMVQLLKSLFSSKGFKKVIPNFLMHLVELKVFMTLHLSQSIVFKLEEFKDLNVPIARYTISWMTDKITKTKSYDFFKWNDTNEAGEKKIHSESEIWLRLVKPAFSNNGVKKMNNKKNKRKNNKNRISSSNQEPAHYYFDSISLSATKMPLVTISFHLPVPFYDTHKDWILECNVGPVKILSAATKKTLSEANQECLDHDIWVDVSKIEEKLCRQCGNTKKENDGGFCGFCRLVFYCSVDCQAKDWKKHRKEECGKSQSM
jgi:hypothetical protein